MVEVIDKSVESVLAQYEELKRSAAPEWIRALRESAISRFTDLGFPNTRQEDWKFTNVSPIARGRFRFGDGADRQGLDLAHLEELSFGKFPCHRLVFVNGLYAPDLSSIGEIPKGALLMNLALAWQKHRDLLEPALGQIASGQNHSFAAMNTAFLRDGAFLHLAKGVEFRNPIHLLFVSTGKTANSASHPRNLFLAGEGSRATVVESYVSTKEGTYFTNPVTEIVVGKNAALDHYKLQRESAEAFHVSVTQAKLLRDSRFHSVSVSLGGKLVRNDLGATLEAEGSECRLDGFYLAGGEQFVDNHTTIDHISPHGTSRELYKGILHGKAKAVFNGKVIVRPDAQKTDSRQTNKNLVLSEEAEANTKPELEIYANDVKCNHGATIGRLDENAIFYLLSRGIGQTEARSILSHAFADEVIDRIQIEAIRKGLDCLLLLSMPAVPLREESV